MSTLKFWARLLMFIGMIIMLTISLELIISKVYYKLLSVYSLPESDINLTLLSFIISLLFLMLLTINLNYWKISKST